MRELEYEMVWRDGQWLRVFECVCGRCVETASLPHVCECGARTDLDRIGT